MGFSKGDKVRVIAKDSLCRGDTAEITYGFKDDKSYMLRLDESNIIRSFYEFELELVDEKREALIELAETLDKARLQAKAIDVTDHSQGVYGQVSYALQGTLYLIDFHNRQAVFEALLDGNTVRQALAAVVK